MRRALTTGLAALLLPLAAWAQEVPAQQGQEGTQAKLERVRSHYSGPVAERVRELMGEARESGVPAEMVVDKALEGAAKAVPADRLLPAVTAHAERLRRGAELVGPSADRASLAAASDALKQGVPGKEIRTVAREAGEDRAMALVVLGDLVQMGVPVQHARDVVMEALASGRGPMEMLAVPGAVRRRVRQGMPPVKAAEEVAHDLALGRAFEGTPAGGGGPAGRGGGPPGGPPVPPGSGPPDDPEGQGGGDRGGGGLSLS